MVQDAVEHRHGEQSVAGEGCFPTAEGEIRAAEREFGVPLPCSFSYSMVSLCPG
jgi:hypothetical protein